MSPPPIGGDVDHAEIALRFLRHESPRAVTRQFDYYVKLLTASPPRRQLQSRRRASRRTDKERMEAMHARRRPTLAALRCERTARQFLSLSGAVAGSRCAEALRASCSSKNREAVLSLAGTALRFQVCRSATRFCLTKLHFVEG
jgi:hypothetical protein